MASPVDLKEFVTGFLLEADEHLHSVNKNFVDTSEALKKNLPEPRAIRELFRSIHTIKGLASMVGAEPIVDITHEMESILRLSDRAGGKISERSLNLLLEGTRAIEERVQALSKKGVEGIPAAPKQLIEALAIEANVTNNTHSSHEIEINLAPSLLKSLSASDKEQIFQATVSDKRVLLIEFQPSSEKASQGFTITSIRDFLGKKGDLVKVIPQSSPDAPTGISFFLILVTLEENKALLGAGVTENKITDIVVERPGNVEEILDVADESDVKEITAASSDQTSIRVDVRRLDEALERLSELVVTRFKLARAIAKLTEQGVDTRELNVVVSDQSRQLKRLRTAITASRMVPLSELLQRIPLVVRGLTKDSGKSVNVIIKASSAEVDKAVADKIFPAVIHLIRNAVDHALETEQERKKLNKEEAGTITITCDDSSGSSLMLTIKDDGRGIDREAVARKSGKPVARTDEELLNQITIPGLSTRENVTHTSGRGMGMDIVKKTIELLGGVFTLKSTPGEGTCFNLKVPVSITIIDVFSFMSDGQIFVAPISMIEEIIEINPSRLMKSPVPSKAGPAPRLIQHRGNTIPLFALDSVLNKRPDGHSLSGKALIVQRGNNAMAFGVDRMLGQQEVVVRPLDDLLFRSPGMSGATDLGNGQPTLVLDLSTLGAVMMSHAESSV